jgi:CBS domain-containing protein
MIVSELMSRDVRTCLASASLNDVARIMWEHDCGCVPVVDAEGVVIAMITDRDVCMAAYTQGRRLMYMTVDGAASKTIVTIGERESIDRAEELMRDAQVRRLPVVDERGRIVGLLSVSDLARRLQDRADRHRAPLLDALAGISRARDAEHVAVELKSDLKKSLELLQMLRDEVRVHLHLGSLELKNQWQKLEPHIGDVEAKANHLNEASRAAVHEALKRLEALRASLSPR